jgi:peroxiredoxin
MKTLLHAIPLLGGVALGWLSLAACASGGATDVATRGPSVAAVSGSQSASNAPDFAGRDIDGKTFHLSDHLGKEVILLDFWATFCEPCKAEFPHLRAMFEEQRSKGLLVVAVAMDGPETTADVPAFVRRFGIDFPVVVDEDSSIASLYNPKKSMPLSVLIDRSGHIARVREGYNPGDQTLIAADVAAALSRPAASR